MASMRTGTQVPGGVGLTDLQGFWGKLPGPALVGLAPAQAINFRACSPNSSRPTICSNFRAEPRRNIPVFVQRHFFRLEEFCLSPLIVLPAARD